MKTLTLITLDQLHSVTIAVPQYGYTASLHMSIHTNDTREHNGRISFFDCGQAYDYRTCTIDTWMMPAAQKTALNAFLRDSTQGRTSNLMLQLGNNHSGFFPFGPDLGDVGNFTINITDRKQGGSLLSPWKYFSDGFTMVMVSASSYSPAGGTRQGNFSVAGVDDLMFPQAGFKPESKYSVNTDITRNGTPYYTDGSQSSDYWLSKFDQELNTGKAAKLLTALANVRDGSMSIIAGSDYYLFGGDNYGAGIFAVKSLGSQTTSNEIVINARHVAGNRWTIPLVFVYEDSIAGYTFNCPLYASGTGSNVYSAPLYVTHETGAFDTFTAPLKAATDGNNYVVVDLDYDDTLDVGKNNELKPHALVSARLPELTTTARLAWAASTGQLVYDTTLGAVFLYDGTAWEKL
jgi:hypothetical protein